MSEAKVCLVTVTYGHRLRYVLQALESALKEDIHHAVVIDNGSVKPVKEELRRRFGDWLTVERFERNQGSAPAFKRGIQLACDSCCELVLLLDDDNLLSEGCLERLQMSRLKLARTYGDNNCMVLGYRPGHLPGDTITDTSSYLGFDVKRFCKKLLSRLGAPVDAYAARNSVGLEAIPYAPYSGLLFHQSLVSRHRLPREDFVLYADDTEFTYRVTKEGGRIALDRCAKIMEIELSWGQRQSRLGFIDSFICQGTDTAVYYNTRNRIFFESHLREHSKIVRSINAGIVRVLLTCYAVCKNRSKRMKVLNQATADGVSGALGVNGCYKLAGHDDRTP
jgi:GT2 family glycosyltransferase